MVAAVALDTQYEQMQGLVLKAQAGDQKALQQVWLQYLPMVQKVLKKCRIPFHDQADVTQDIFVLYITYIKQLKCAAAMLVWLRRLVSRYCWEYLQRSRNALKAQRKYQHHWLSAQRHSLESMATTTTSSMSFGNVACRDLIDHIITNVRKFRPKLAEVFIQFFVEHRTIEAIAQEKGVQRGVISWKVDRLRDFLRMKYPDLPELLQS